MPTASFTSDSVDWLATGVLDANKRIAVDLSCMHCSYNLRTLVADGTCPECGQPVAQSVANYAERPRQWLVSVGDGAWGLVVCIGVLLGSTVLAVVGTLLVHESFAIAVFVGLLLDAVHVPLCLLAFTARGRHEPPRREGLSARRVIRACILIPLLALGVVVLCAPAALSGTNSSAAGLFESLTDWVLPMVGGTCALVLPLAICCHAHALMERIGQAAVARSAYRVLGATAILEAFLVAVGTATLATPLLLSGAAVWIGASAALGALLAQFVLLMRVARAFLGAQRSAAKLKAQLIC
jgi:hypothetical protein